MKLYSFITFIYGFLKPILVILITVSAFIGFFSSFHDLKTFILWLKVPWDKKRDFLKSVEHLRNATDYFDAHIIQLGGEFSMIYSIQVICNEDGGWYLNPPKEFVSVGFNRGGLMVVMPSEITTSAGFVIDSMSKDGSDWVPSPNPDICHPPIPDIKNNWIIRFKKSKRCPLL